MKKLVLSLTVASVLVVNGVAGSMAEPTQIENGQTYTAKHDDTTQNFYTFSISQDANVVFSISENISSAYSTITFYDSDLNEYQSSNCGNKTKVQGSFSCQFTKGSYIIQAAGYYDTASFSVFSKSMSDYVPPITPPSSDLEIVEITKNTIDNLSEGWHLLGTSIIINDLSIFENAQMVWSWNSGDWEAYSPQSAMQSVLDNKSEIGKLNQIEAGKGFWIKK